MFQVKIGIRNMVIPGARRVRIVVTRLTAPKMVPEAGQRQAEDPQVGADTGREQAAVQRRVREPAEVGSAVRGQEAGDRPIRPPKA